MRSSSWVSSNSNRVESGQLLVSGKNDSGQLAMCPKETPEVDGVILHESLNQMYEVEDIGTGTFHSVFLVRERKFPRRRHLLTCGHKGGLGVPRYQDTHRLQDLKISGVPDYDKVDFLIVKFNSSAIIDSDNNMYFWGENFDGSKTPELICNFEHRLLDLSFGYKHALALLEGGKVYSWGDGTYGELGLGKACMVPEPVEIKWFSKQDIEIVKVEAGSRHSLCLGANGKMYGFGTDCTDKMFELRVNIPVQFDKLNQEIIDIFAGDKHTVAVTKNGNLFRWEGAVGTPEEVNEVSGKLIYDVVTGASNTIVIA